MFDKKQWGALNNSNPQGGYPGELRVVDETPLTKVVQTSLADTQGALFRLKNVFYKPVIPKTDEPLTITGDIDLFNIKYFPFAWVVVTIDYPKEWWQLFGAQKEQHTQVVNGSFKIDLPDGFSKEGEYNLSIDIYGGPTMTVSGLILPPFPAFAHYDTKFNVSGSIASETAFTLEAPQSNGSSQHKEIVAGSNVALSFPVTSKSNSEVQVQLSVEVHEAGTVLAAGQILTTKNFDPVYVQPGATATFDMAYKDVGAVDKERSIVEKLSIGSKLAPNTSPNNPYAWNDIYKITAAAPGTSFTLGAPGINGSTSKKAIASGSQITLSFPVKSTSTTPVDAHLNVEVRESGTILSAGQLLVSKSFDTVTIQPGETKVLQMQYTDTGTADKDRSIVEALYVGSSSTLTPKTDPNNPYSWNDIYTISAKQSGLSFSFEPIALLDSASNPLPHDQELGATVRIRCGVTVTTATPGDGILTAGFRIRETSLIGTGDWLTDLTMSASEVPLASSSVSSRFAFYWDVGGAQGGKDGVLYLFVDGVEVAHKDYSNFVGCLIPRQLTVIINPAGAGQVVDDHNQPFSSNSVFPDGQYVTLNIPSQYQANFKNWTGDLGSMTGWAAPYITVQMTKDLTVYANFTGAVTPGTVSFTMKPTNYPSDKQFWLLRHYDQNGNRDYESSSGSIAKLALDSVSPGGHFEAWFADGLGQWNQQVTSAFFTATDGKDYEWDIGANSIHEPSGAPQTVTFSVELTGLGGEPDAYYWQVQRFDAQGQYLYAGPWVYVTTATQLIMDTPPDGNIGVQLADYNGNSLGTHYSQKFTARNSYYEFNYSTSTITEV